jgi:transposase
MISKEGGIFEEGSSEEGPRMWTKANRARYNRDQLRYPSDVTEEEWGQLAALIPPARRGGCKRTVDIRAVLNGLLYVLSSGCQWRAIPRDLPPRSTIFDSLGRWQADGTVGQIHETLYVRCREQAARPASPSACLSDSQSVKSAEKGGLRLTPRALTRANGSKGRSVTC